MLNIGFYNIQVEHAGTFEEEVPFLGCKVWPSRCWTLHVFIVVGPAGCGGRRSGHAVHEVPE